VARRKKLILAEFAVTVWETHVDWDGLDAVLWRLLHAKPASGFLPQLRAARGRRNLRLTPSK
jgi:hypothetical protein